jgi:hypothetical protein
MKPLLPNAPHGHGTLCNTSQLLFLSGVSLILGFDRTKNLFFKPEKLRGSAMFFLGLFLVIFRWPKLGFIVEVSLGLRSSLKSAFDTASGRWAGGKEARHSGCGGAEQKENGMVQTE